MCYGKRSTKNSKNTSNKLLKMATDTAKIRTFCIRSARKIQLWLIQRMNRHMGRISIQKPAEKVAKEKLPIVEDQQCTPATIR